MTLNVDSIDWEAEAKRLAQAFRVVGEYEFSEDADGQTRRLKRPMNWLAIVKARYLNGREMYWRQVPFRVPTENGLYLTVSYLLNPDVFRKVITISDSEIVFRKVGDTGLRIDRHGAALFTPSYLNRYSVQLAKGLFHLDLLTPQAEAALAVTITTHQKMEWALEYAEQNDL